MMDQETTGTVVAVFTQWWLKINTKAFRTHPADGAKFPHIIKVTYHVNGKSYTKRKWISAGNAVPVTGTRVRVLYKKSNPARAKVWLSPFQKVCE